MAPSPHADRPLWDGSPLDGASLLLHANQGLGDTLMFIRYAPLVAARGGRVLVQCQPCLIPLLASCPEIDRLIPEGVSPLEFDVQAPLLSLPGLLGTTVETIPAEIPYVFARPDLVATWRHELAPIRGFRVGIAWQGNSGHYWDHRRSFPLELYEPLSRIDGVQLISLQKGFGAEQLDALGGRFPVVNLDDRLDETSGSFLDTAAVLHQLDLLIAPDTAVAHLAGAMGVPVWVALCRSPDWRWMSDRDDSPWYPTMQLFRQETLGDWVRVFARMAAALRRASACGHAQPGRSVRVEVTLGELFDKISILEIKSERVTDSEMLRHVRAELSSLRTARDRALGEQGVSEVGPLAAELRAVNERLWQVEDNIRACEWDGDFGPRFVALAREVYCTNDRRASLKRGINEALGSSKVEQKLYTAYPQDGSGHPGRGAPPLRRPEVMAGPDRPMGRLSLVDIDACSIYVRSDCDRVHSYLVDFCHAKGLGYQPIHGTSDPANPTIVYRDSGRYEMVYDGATATLSLSAPWAAVDDSLLLPQALWLAAELVRQRRSEYTLHASAVARDGLVTVLYGPSESGKTMVALDLCLRHGYSLVANDDLRVTAVDGRPLVIRGDSVFNFRYSSVFKYSQTLCDKVFPEVTSGPVSLWNIKSSIPPERLGIAPCRERLPVGTFVFVKADSDCSEVVSEWVSDLSTENDFIRYKAELYKHLSNHVRGSIVVPFDKALHYLPMCVPSFDTPELAARRVAFLDASFSGCRALMIRGPLLGITETLAGRLT